MCAQIDHEFVREPFEGSPQRVDRQRVRNGQERDGLEHVLTGPGAAREFRLQLFDAHVAVQQRARHFLNDARAIVPDELEIHQPPVACRSLARNLSDDDAQSRCFELAQRRSHRLRFIGGHFPPNDSRELAGKARHAAFRPVGVERAPPIRERAHDAGSIGADDGNDKGNVHAS